MQERNYGIDFLRIISMFMIVILHILGNGGILASVQIGSSNYHLAWILEIASYCAVNCYALISAYVGIYSVHKYSNIFYLWLQVIFYTLSITLLFNILSPSSVTISSWLNALFPISRKQYWYFTAYFCMFFFIPYFTVLLNNLSKKELTTLCLTILIMLCVLPTFAQDDIFQTSYGYSFLWLSSLYILGGYIRKYTSSFTRIRHKIIMVYPLCIFITWFMQYMIDTSPSDITAIFKSGNPLLSYTSPTIFLSAFSLFLFFSNMNIRPFMKKLIKFIAPLSFSVYLIHTQPFFWNKMTNLFVPYASFSPLKLGVSIFSTALFIYISCSSIDFIRNLIFRLLHIRSATQKIDTYITRRLNQ